MNVLIIGSDRAMCLKALELADKECDRTRDALDRLQLEDMNVRALQGVFGKIRIALNDLKRRDFDWDFATRRALGIALLFYKAKINQRRDGDEKLLVDPRDILRKLGEVVSLLEALSGQETLFTKSISWTEPKAAPSLPADAPAATQAQMDLDGDATKKNGRWDRTHQSKPAKTKKGRASTEQRTET